MFGQHSSMFFYNMGDRHRFYYSYKHEFNKTVIYILAQMVSLLWYQHIF